MPVSLIVGIQWGDEGKGKIIDFLTEKADVVARFQGGNNAGHTVEIGDKKFILHLVPSGIFRENTLCLICNGVVVDPIALMIEMKELEKQGIQFKNRIQISTRAHLVMSYHKLIDGLYEQRRKEGEKIGTTKRGIGPAYADKASRTGIRACDILDKTLLRAKFARQFEYYNNIFESYSSQTLSFEEEWEKLKEAADYISPYIEDTVLTINKAAKENKNVVLEGAQGMWLDVDYGTYPFVTSSNTTAGGACTGSGLSPKYINNVVGIMKAYTTRVGEGPFPTELNDSIGEYIRSKGNEFGASTGRPRRCGWFDAVSAKYSCMVNGVDSLAITKLDVLDELDEIKVCTAYEINGKISYDMPSITEKIAIAKPIYETIPGWKTKTSNISCWDKMPSKTKEYIQYISKLVGSKASIISIGPRRDQTFIL
ncbi:MAG TPA: adenylosuccinate synthase [Victivallales bacterium]|nr:adenylosuccinate synthase [Victivallales bacterium]HRR28008.1 adenylosuccinate synthase [Victivallales bacterium]